MQQKRSRYRREEREAVICMLESGIAVHDICEALGIPAQTVWRWFAASRRARYEEEVGRLRSTLRIAVHARRQMLRAPRRRR